MYTRTRALLVVWSGLIVAVAALAGCGIAHRTQAQDQANLQAARNAQLVTQSDFALADCNAKFPAGNPKIQVARMRCLNDALAIQMPIFGPYQDLMQTWMAARMAVAEQIQNRKMTIAEGDAIIAEKWSQVVSESERRQNATQSVIAQQGAAAAQQSAAAAANTAARAAPIFPPIPPATNPLVSCISTPTPGGGSFTTCN